MKTLSRCIPEIATIEEINFNFKFEKLTLPIHDGLSLWFPTSILDIKFSLIGVTKMSFSLFYLIFYI